MSITSLRGSTLPNKSFSAGKSKTKNIVRIAPDTATTFANGAAISAGGGGGGGPTISNVSVTDSSYILSNTTPYIDSTGGYIKITGTGFATGCTVYVSGTPATSTTFVSATEVRAQVGAASSNAQSVYVVNTDSSVGIKLNAITYSGTPSWSTDSTLTSQLTDISFNIPLSATSDSSIIYTLASGSSVPSGTTLYSNGVFAGTVTGISNDTNYSFTVVATDVENQLSTRAFTVTVTPGDQYMNTTTLLLNGDIGNVWITDSSTNNFLPTITADVKPTAFSPYNTSWSAYFDGTGDYISTSSSSTLTPGSTFTMECWIYAISGGGIIVDNRPETANGSYFQIAASSGTIAVYVNSGVIGQTGVFISDSSWYHVAYVRTGGVGKIYIDGLQRASFADTTTYVETVWKIGYAAFNSGWFKGYISNLRYVNGTSVFTGNFTPQTTTLGNTQSAGSNIAAITSGSTLLTLQDNRFKDNGTNAFTITRFGDTAIKSIGPFTETDIITGSAYFDGTGDYLDYTGSANLAFGTSDWTIELWVYFTSVSGDIIIYDSRPTGTNGVYPTIYKHTDNSFRYYSSTTERIASTTTVIANTWFHVAVARVSGTTRMFVNGTVQTTTYTDSDTLLNGASRPRIGASGVNGAAGVTGYISDVRVLKGTGQYTANFTPATSSLSSVANTQLLTLQYRRGENNHRFVDEGGSKYVAIRNGQVSQGSFSPFSPAGWSGYFNGSSDYLSIAASTAFNNVSGTTFTIEFWMYPTAFAAGTLYNEARTIFSTAGTYPNGWRVELTTTSIVFYDYVGTQRISYTASLNTWTHVAFTYSSNNLIMYINGQNRGSASSVTWNNSSGNALIGALNSGSYLYYYQGYISNLRLVSELVYTGNFTPQTSSLTVTQSSESNIAAITTGQTVFLTLQNNRFIDANTTPKTISVAAGAPKIQAFSPYRPSGSYVPATHGGSAYFDGSGDYLKALSTSNTLLPTSTTNTFTIDGWIYPTTTGTRYFIIGDLDPTGASNNVGVDVSTGNKVELYWYPGTATRATSVDSVVPNQWNYFAIVVNANAINIYVNSTTAGQTGTTTLTTRSLATVGWGIGSYNSTEIFTGYMSDIRWSTGIARTISSIPTAPPAPDNYTTFLMKFNNAGIVDATSRQNFETLGNVTISNVASKFGSGSLSFDGTGDYVVAPSNPAWAFGTGDFTVECWVYFNSTSGTFVPFAQSDALGSSTNDKWFFALGSNTLRLQTHSSGGFTCTTPWTPSTGIWYHIAAVRSSGTILLFIDGTSGTVTTTGTPSGYSLSQNGLSIGAMSTPYYLNGYIDDFRITKYSRYTAGFSVPTRAHLTK